MYKPRLQNKLFSLLQKQNRYIAQEDNIIEYEIYTRNDFKVALWLLHAL